MRIAICSDIYYPMTNGVAVFAHNLANGLTRLGHEVLVVSPSFDGKFHIDDEGGVKVAHLTSARFPFYPDQINKVPEKKEVLGVEIPRVAYRHGIWWSVNPWFEVEKVLNDFKPEVIHLQTAETIALAVRSYVRKYNVPLVATNHAYPDNVTGQFKILKPVKKVTDKAVNVYMTSFLKHAEYATMPTEMAIEDLTPKNPKRFKVPIEALSNGVDLSAYKPGRPDVKVLEKYGVVDGFRKGERRPLRVLYVGRVDPEKSISYVVEAFSKVLKKVPEVEMVVVGDGTDLNHLKDLAERLGLSGSLCDIETADSAGNKVVNSSDGRIKFLGRVLPPDLNEIYRTGTVFVTASETETQGIVLIEAAATGLPLIAVDKGAVSELCQDGVNGILCRPGGDVDGIAEAMVSILSDAQLREKYSAASIEIAKKHDLKRTLKRFLEIYEEAIELKNGGEAV